MSVSPIYVITIYVSGLAAISISKICILLLFAFFHSFSLCFLINQTLSAKLEPLHCNAFLRRVKWPENKTGSQSLSFL